MRSRDRVPTSVSSPGVPRMSARPGCTTIPRGDDPPPTRTVSSSLRENGLTSVSVPLARLAKNSRLASGVQAGVPGPLPPAARRRTRRLRRTTSAPLRPPRRGPTASRVRPGESARLPPAPRGSRMRRSPARRAPRGIVRRLPRAETIVAPSGTTATPVAPGTGTRRSRRRARASTIATRPRLSTTAARRSARPSATAEPRPPRPTEPTSSSVLARRTRRRVPWTAYRRSPSRDSARPVIVALPCARRVISVRSLTSSETIVAPAATKPRLPSLSTATAVLGAGSAMLATTRSEETSSSASSGVPVATSATRACAAGSGARTNASAARRTACRRLTSVGDATREDLHGAPLRRAEGPSDQ